MAKSFSIKVGADTSDFISSLKAADRQINSTTKLGNELNKSLAVEYSPTRAIEAQKAFQSALSQTEEKAKAIREQMKIMEQRGEIDTEGYKKLHTELAKIETKAIKVKQSLEEAKNVKVEELSAKFKEVGSSIEGAGKKLSVFSAAAAGAIAGAVKLAKEAVTTGDEIATLATQYDMSTKAIQQWQYVAMQTDVTSQTILKSIQKTQAAFGEQATGGSSSAVKALEALGLSYQNFNSNEDAYQAVIDSLSAISDKTIQAAYATDIFGERYASDLIPLLQTGKGAVADYVKEFEQVGYLSEETVNQLADLDNEINKVTAQWELAKTQLGVAMIPIYETLIKLLEEKVIPAVEKLAKWFSNLNPAGQDAVLGILAVIAAAAPLLILVGKLTTGIGDLIKNLPNFGKALQLLNTPIGSVAAGMATLAITAKLIYDVMSAWSDMSTWQKVVSVLGIVTVAALGAAIALGAFHSAWSLGLAVAGIVAGIVAVTAAVNAAKKDISGVSDFSSPSVASSNGSYTPSAQDLADMNSWTQSARNGTSGGSTTYQSTEDNSNLIVNVYVTESAASAEEIAQAVSKEIATLSQSRGR